MSTDSDSLQDCPGKSATETTGRSRSCVQGRRGSGLRLRDNLIRDNVFRGPPLVARRVRASRASRSDGPPWRLLRSAGHNSEDAIILSYFGSFLAETAAARAAFANWLLDRVSLTDLARSEPSQLDLWHRIAHLTGQRPTRRCMSERRAEAEAKARKRRGPTPKPDGLVEAPTPYLAAASS